MDGKWLLFTLVEFVFSAWRFFEVIYCPLPLCISNSWHASWNGTGKSNLNSSSCVSNEISTQWSGTRGIHHEITEGTDKNKSSASKEIFLVGQFLQFRAVSSTFDDDGFLFHSRLFEVAIPHRFQLKLLMRQADKTFITPLKELRLDVCTPETYTACAWTSVL